MDSTKFDAASLVSLSNAVSLVLAPAAKSWHPDAATYPHFYLVPLQATASGAACETAVWQEVQQYQNSLRQWTASQDKRVVFAEVVLPSKHAGTNFYQARIHAMVVPRKLSLDAPLAFESALQDLALEHGTHQKKALPLRKPLPQLVPAHFPYLYVEWDDGQQGKVLVLEEEKSVSIDWPLEVLGGRLGLDPLRMRARGQTTGMAARVEALQGWKDFDWTLANESSKVNNS